MKTVLAVGLFAAGTALTSGQMASAMTITSSSDEGAICQDMFARLDRKERGLQFAQAETNEQKQSTEATEDELATELSALLQACSYDGKAFKVDPRELAAAASAGGDVAVQTIMRFTGLPQNFKVMEGDVPNAAAIIVMGADGVPERVIAYNQGFMEQVRSATENNDWASISIMAHEIGHHLSGHTLMPGGSQPPIELEADKFSGFVLFKMGAGLADAQKAIATLVPEEDGPTHPGRPKRLAAIESGWSESCEQQGGSGCGSGVAVSRVEPSAPADPVEQPGPSAPAPGEPPAASETPATSAPAPVEQDVAGLSREEIEQRLIELMNKLSEPGADVETIARQIEVLNAAAEAKNAVKAPSVAATPKMPDIPKATDIPMPGERKPESEVVIGSLDRMPRLEPSATPSKFDRFVYDEVGVFDREAKEKLAKLAFDYAAAANVEIVTIIAKDLQGRSADQFALDAMRQLRVGKLDVGNGAVLVAAPDAKQVGVALGAGLLVEYDDVEPLRGYLQSYLELLDGGARQTAASDLVADASYRIMRDTQAWEWTVRYQSLDEMIAAAARYRNELDATGAAYDPKKDPTWRKLARITATVVTKSPSKDDKMLDINEVKERGVGPAMHVRTQDGKNAVLYVNASVPALMPVTLDEGRTYSFVVRDSFLAADTPQFDLISYDLLD